MSNIRKSFNGVPVLHDVHFTAHGGEIHALLGANGAGKSTLMKLLSGAYSPDQGTVALDDVGLKIGSPLDAKRGGIHCVYQEVDTALIPQLSVAENVMLDRIAAGSLWVRPKQVAREAEQALAELGVHIPLHKRVDQLTLAEKQMVVIARTLVEQAKVIVFDEPTAPLSQEETERLFRVMRQMRAQGKVIIFITHRLPEVFAECDRLTVLRDGQHVYEAAIRDTVPDEVVRQMLGRTFNEPFPKVDVVRGSIVLRAEGLRAGNKVRGVDLDVRQGEIVSIVGLVGAGKTELSRLLGGADVMEAGAITINDKRVTIAQPADAIANGIVLVPEERRKQGIFVHESVRTNLSLPLLRKLSRGGFVSRAQERLLSQRIIERFGIKASTDAIASKYLSGGNQQKVSIGKWVETDAAVYVLDEPTKGVDVGAKSDIFRIIGQLAEQGKSIVYLTCEFGEAIGIADRVIVMCDGIFVKQFERNEVTQEQLLFYASAGQEGENE
ncbi:sugar ABC transporter ATP-binding protein [Paenibacillus sp. 481]|nr:sugar ABC transporter ATP-binding protein [Paenibacillus sp. 481]UHA76224.1 sugar ABC transporter ATP-binding protein [Paenibacillus sp. 481]